MTAIVYVLVFIAFVDNFAMLPTIAPYAQQMDAGLTGVGVAVGAYSVTNLVFNLVGGVLLDRVGRRWLVVGSLVLVGAAMLCYPLASTLGALVAVRLLHGIGGGILVPAIFTLLGDLAPAGGRSRTMGRAGAIIGMAAVVGPGVAGGVRKALGFSGVFGMIAVVMGLGALIAAVGLAETRRSAPGAGDGARVLTLLRRPDLRLACLSAFVFTGAVGTLAAFLPVHVEGTGGSAAASGGMFTLFAAVAVAVMLSRAAGLADLRGPRTPIAVGFGVYAVALGVLATGPAIAVTAVAAGVFGLGYALVFPAMASAVGASSGADERGRAYGLFMAFFSLGFVVLPPVGGMVGDAWPAAGAFSASAALCVVGATLIAARAGRRRA